jgi:Putative glucoamylase
MESSAATRWPLSRTDKCVCVLIAHLTLLGLVSPSCSANGPSRGVPPRSHMILDDFDGKRHASLAWQVLPSAAGSRADLALTSAPAQVVHGKALHLRYWFPPAALALAPAGLHSQAAELRVRLSLPDVDARAYDALVFWIKGDAALGFATELEVGFLRPHPALLGMFQAGSFRVSGVTDRWQRMVIPLRLMPGLDEWTHLRAFFLSIHPRASPTPRGAYFLDEIMLVSTGEAGPSVTDSVPTPAKQAWKAALGGPDTVQAQLKERLAGWPRVALVEPRTLPNDDTAFLWRLARDTWRGLVAMTDRASGLPIDHLRFRHPSVALPDATIGDYTNITNIGLQLVAVAAAHKAGLVAEREAVTMLEQTLTTLERLETFGGFFYNYYDTTSLERSSHYISFVDSAWLTTGLIVVRNAFPVLAVRCTRLINRGNYRFFLDPLYEVMFQGYHVNLSRPSAYHYGLLYTEARLGSLLAIGKGDVSAEHWFKLHRTLPNTLEYAWQSQSPINRIVKYTSDQPYFGGYYEWRGVRFVPSWGGSMFEALMPSLVLDELRYAPASLGLNDRTHAVIQRRYAQEELGYPVWGLSPSASPGTGAYEEYGVKPLGVRGYGAGAVTPHAAALALSVMPQAAITNLRQLARRYPLYGDFGFYDSVDPVSGRVAYQYLYLGQAMLFIAGINHLTDYAVHRLFDADPIIQQVLPLLRVEQFFDGS